MADVDEIVPAHLAGLPPPTFNRGEVARRAGRYSKQPLESLLPLVTKAPADLEAIVAGVQLRIADRVVAKAGRKVAPSRRERRRWRLSEAELVACIAWKLVEAILGTKGGAA